MGETAGLMRSAEVSFSVHAGNLEGLTRTDEALDKLEAHGTRVNKLLSNLGGGRSSQGLSTLARRLDKVNGNFDSLSKRVSQSQTEIDGTLKSLADSSVTSTERIGKAFSSAKTSVRDSLKGIPKTVDIKVKDNTGQTRKSLNQTRQATGDFEKTSTRSMSNVASHAAKAATSYERVKKAGSGMMDVGRTMTGATAVMGAGFLYAANQATKLQNQFTTVRNLVVNGGESMAEATRNVTKMQAQGAAMSTKYGTAQSEIAKGYEELVRRGYSSRQALASQKTFLQGSIASGDSYSDTVSNSTSALEQFGMRSKNDKVMKANSKKAVNQMAYAADLTATDFQGIGSGLRYAGATSHSAHQSLGNTAAALGDLSNYGQDGTIAGTGLRKVLNGLISPGKKSGLPVLEQLGINPSQLKDSKGNLKSLVDIFDLLNKHMKGMTSTQRTDLFHTMFGTTGQETALILSNSTKQLRKLNGQVAQSTKNNYIGKLSKQNMNSWQNQLKVFKATATETGIEFAKTVLPSITSVLKGVNGLLRNVNKLSDGQKKVVAFGAMTAAAFGPAALAIGSVVKALGYVRQGISVLPTGKLGQIGSIGLKGAHYAGKTPVTTTATRSAANATGAVASGASKWLNRAAIIGVAADAGYSAVKSIREGIDTKQGGHDMWHAAGTVVGGGIGMMIGGAPGAMLGAQIGKGAADVISKTKLVAHIQTDYKKDVKKTPKSAYALPGTTGGAHFDGTSGATKRHGMQVAPGETTQDDKKFEDARKRKPGVAKIAKPVARGMKQVASRLGNTTARYDQMVSFNYDRQSLSKTNAALKSYTSANGKAYDTVLKSAKSNAKQSEKQSKSNLKSFVSSGLMTQSAAEKAYKSEKSSYSKRVKSARTALNTIKTVEVQTANDISVNQNKHEAKMASISKSYANKRKSIKRDETSELSELQRKGYVKINGSTLKGESGRRAIVERYDNRIKAANKSENSSKAKEDKRSEKQRTRISEDANRKRLRAMARAQSKTDLTLSGNAKQQKAILTKMKNTSGKLSDQQASKMIKASYKTMNSTISHANKTYKGAKSAADKKYNATVKKAQQEYYQNGSISYKQYKSVISHAKSQRDNAITAASDQKKETVRQAKNQHSDVVSQAQAQTKDHLASINSETGQAKGLWEKFTSFLSNQVNKISHFDTGVTTGQHSVAQENSTTSKIFKTNSAKGKNKIKNVNASVFSTPVNKSKKYMMPGNATGGQITRDTRSLVGEGGIEAAINKHTGRMRLLGVNGPAVEKLHAGETVLPANHTAKLFKGGLGAGKTLPGYAGGTSDVWGAIGNLYKNADDLTGAGAGSDFASDPAGAAKKYIKGQGWDKLTKKHGIQGAIVKAGQNALTKVTSNALGKLSEKLEDSSGGFGDAGGSLGNLKGGNVGRWRPYVAKALKANGFSASAFQIAAWMRVIQRESNGNPSAINNSDSNAKAGHPSIGLVQTIGPTFNANKFPGHGNIRNGYDDLLAGIHYAASAYGRGNGMFARVSGPLGYANGGWSNKPAIFGEYPGQPEMAINPARDTADGQILDVAKKRARISKGSIFNKLFSPDTRTKMLEKVHEDGPVMNRTNSATKANGRKVTGSNKGTIKIDMHPTINVYTNGGDGKQIGSDVASQVRAVVQQMFQGYLDNREGGDI